MHVICLFRSQAVSGGGGGCVFFSGLFGRNCCSHEYVVCRGFGLCGIGGVAEFGLWEYLDRE